MKITKRVEECIREQLWEKASAAYHLDELNKKREAALNLWKEHVEKVERRVETELQEFAKSFGYSATDYRGDPVWPTVDIRGREFDALPECKAYDTATRNARMAVDKAVREVILRMELGGTRDELQKVLDEVTF